MGKSEGLLTYKMQMEQPDGLNTNILNPDRTETRTPDGRGPHLKKSSYIFVAHISIMLFGLKINTSDV